MINDFGVDIRRVAVASVVEVSNGFDGSLTTGTVMRLDGVNGVVHLPSLGGLYVFSLFNVTRIVAYPNPLKEAIGGEE